MFEAPAFPTNPSGSTSRCTTFYDSASYFVTSKHGCGSKLKRWGHAGVSVFGSTDPVPFWYIFLSQSYHCSKRRRIPKTNNPTAGKAARIHCSPAGGCPWWSLAPPLRPSKTSGVSNWVPNRGSVLSKGKHSERLSLKRDKIRGYLLFKAKLLFWFRLENYARVISK